MLIQNPFNLRKGAEEGKNMEEFLDENTYLLDLSNIEYIPEIIYKLSSVLEQEDLKNRSICLKLGDVKLNQAQLLSIKSLISGFGSSLSSIDTKSEDTEKTAISIGIVVSNASSENITDNTNEAVEEIKEEKQTEIPETEENDNIIKETQILKEQEETPEVIENNTQEDIIIPAQEEIEPETEPVLETEPDISNIDTNENETTDNEINETSSEEVQINENETENKSESHDELDVIFNSESIISNVFQAAPTEHYAEREELTDIVVPKDEYTKEDIEIETFPTKYIKQTIRSGQVINYEGNIIIIGDCHPGSEVNAFGDITVWGVLSGIAHAGAAGNSKARVRALKMNAIQLRIANCYSRRPDSLNTIYVEKTNSFTPEEARIINGEIVVFKIND